MVLSSYSIRDNLITQSLCCEAILDGNIMKKCEQSFGSEICLKIIKKKDCLDSCGYLQGLSQEELIDNVIYFLLEDSDVLRAKTDKTIREKVIKKFINIANRIVGTTLNSTGNPRLIMEKEDIEAEMHIVIDLSIDIFDMTKASFKTFMSWRVRGKLANLLRTYRSKKRSVNYFYIVGSLQDETDNNGNDEKSLYEDFIGVEDPNFSRIEREQFIEELSEDEQQVLKLMIDGYNPKDIFRLLDISSIEVYDIISSITIKSQEFNDE